jgi:hypothetical protein
LFFTTKGKAPGASKDSGTSNKKDVHRNAAIIQHFMNGNGKYSPSQILENWLTHPYGANERNSTLMYSTSAPYTKIKPVRAALTSFAAQLVEKKLVKEAETAIKSTNGLHISLSTKKNTTQNLVDWPDVGNATIEKTSKIIQEHQPLTWSLIMKIASRPPRKQDNEKLIRQKRPPETVSMIN